MKKAILISTLFLVSNLCLAAPQPAVVQPAGLWTLDVSFAKPQAILVRPAAGKKPQLFWYQLITITNNTELDVQFYPKCELLTDTLELLEAGTARNDKVFAKIKARHKRKYPFLEDMELTSRRLLQGEDHTKDIAVIWRDFDKDAKNISLFITGMSNESIQIDHPTETDENGQPVKLFLHKTLQLSYKISGKPKKRHKNKLTLTEKIWVMR